MPISSNLLKSLLEKLHLLYLLRQLLWKKFCYLHISTIIVNIVIKIYEKYLLRSSVLEMDFYRLFVTISI